MVTRDQKGYKEWKKAILEKGNHKCSACGTQKRLECHHLLPWKQYEDLRLEIENGIILCKSCHRKIDGFQKGHSPSIEIRKKMSESHKGIIPWNKGKKDTIDPLRECSNCKVTKDIEKFYRTKGRRMRICGECYLKKLKGK